MSAHDYIAMNIAGLAVDPATNSPIVILTDPESEVCLPIWIGFAEASAIAVALKEVEVGRPLTHDLMKSAFDLMHAVVARVSIVDIKDETFFAEIEIKQGEICKILDARPSDAIALALRYSREIHVKKSVLDKSKGLVVKTSPTEIAEENGSFLEIEMKSKSSSLKVGNTAIESFDPSEWSDCLATLEPNDFKYKM